MDLIVHSPGGSAEATASIVRYLRKQFSEVRVIVPHAAMSAATMLALSADVIVMGKQSQLGPIDPQLVTPQGPIPARAILDQFERAKKECSEDSSVLGAWIPMLQQYGPALLEQCQNADSLAKRLVKEWLRTYMFAGDKYAARKALKVAKFFGDHHIHQSHELYPEVVDAREEEGGVPSRLIKTDRREAGKEGTPWRMFAGSPSGRTTRVASRSMISLGRARGG